ncbi:uncharacterized protein [Diadema antillarum]|uniref:uncharacterized protein n=1 Tax=Diadema antillarum TaxID=105358 RepID=UPI003A8834D9
MAARSDVNSRSNCNTEKIIRRRSVERCEEIYLFVKNKLSQKEFLDVLFLNQEYLSTSEYEKFEKDILVLPFFLAMNKCNRYPKDDFQHLCEDLEKIKLFKLSEEVKKMAQELSLIGLVPKVQKMTLQDSQELSVQGPLRSTDPRQANEATRPNLPVLNMRPESQMISHQVPARVETSELVQCPDSSYHHPESGREGLASSHRERQVSAQLPCQPSEAVVQHPEGDQSIPAEEGAMSYAGSLRSGEIFNRPSQNAPSHSPGTDERGSLTGAVIHPSSQQSSAKTCLISKSSPAVLGNQTALRESLEMAVHPSDQHSTLSASQSLGVPLHPSDQHSTLSASQSLGVPLHPSDQQSTLSASQGLSPYPGDGNVSHDSQQIPGVSLGSCQTASSTFSGDLSDHKSAGNVSVQKPSLPISPQDSSPFLANVSLKEIEQLVNAKKREHQTSVKMRQERGLDLDEPREKKKPPLPSDVVTDAVSTYLEPLQTEKPKVKNREHDDDDEKDVCEKRDDDDMEVSFKDEPQNFEIEGIAAQSDVVECEDLQTSAGFLDEEEHLPEVESKSFEAVKEEGEWPALEVAKELNEAKEKKEKEEAAIQYDETTGIEVNLFARMKADPSSLTSKDRDLIQKQMMKHLERKAAPPESKEPKVEFDPDKKLLPYQHELAAPGLMGFNYIMCAPVGTGKALTAAAICNHQRKIAIAKNEEKPYKSLFVSSGQSVSDRHRDAFQNIFPPGAVSVLESPSQFKEVFDLPSVHVVMLTAEQLSQVLKERQIAFIDLTTVVIDECHLIATKHPFNDITKYYLAEKKDLLARKAPRGAWTLGRPYGGISFIIGLTPNLGANLQCFTREFMVRQCGLLDSKGIRRVESVDNLREMLKVNKPPEVDTMLLTSRAQSTINSVFRSVLEKLMSSMEERYSPDGGLQGDTPRKGTKEYRAWIHPKRMLAKQLGEVDRYFPATYLVLLNDALCVHEDLRCKEAMKFLSSEDGKLQAEKGFAASTGKDCHKMFEEQKFELMRLVKEDSPGLSPKLWCLAQKLAEIYEKDAPEAGIILVRSSAIATLLVNIINSNNITTSKGIKAVQLSDPDEGEMEDRDSVVSQQIKIFQDIQQGKANLIVSTDFEQTGLELPSCHFVIRYNLVEEEVRTVQRAARAGAGEGLCFLIAEKYSNLAYEEQRKRDNLKSLEGNLKVLNEMDPKKWYDLVEDKQLAAIRQSAQQDFLRLYQRSSRRPQDYNLLCKNCHKNICNAHYLLRRGDQISCTDSSIKERLKISPLSNSLRTRNHAVTGVLKCTGQVNGRPCENKLGVAVDFFRQTRQEGYGLDVRAFFFSYLEGQSAGYVGQEFSSWDEVDFYIRTEVLPDRSGRTGSGGGGGGRRDDRDDDDDDDNDSRGNRPGSRGNRSTGGSEKEKMDTSNEGRTETGRRRNGGGGESNSNEKRNGGKKHDPRYDPDDGDVER